MQEAKDDTAEQPSAESLSSDHEKGIDITITVKNQKESFSMKVHTGLTVAELRALIAEKVHSVPEQICLIFSGKLMIDKDYLYKLEMAEGNTVHYVIRTLTADSDDQPTVDINATPFGLGSIGGLGSLQNFGLTSNTFLDFQAAMQDMLLNQPDTLRPLMSTLSQQRLLDSPEVIFDMLLSNPRMQEIMDQNPELAQLLNNRDLLRQTMEMSRSPAMLQEMMRTHDRALSNMESTPGGFNLLQRFYNDVHVPLMDATEGYRDLHKPDKTTNSSSVNPQQGHENREPLPNPWAIEDRRRDAENSLILNLSQEGSSSSSAGSQITSLLQQMTQNPTLMESFVSMPFVQDSINALQSDERLLDITLNQNPFLTPQSAQQMRNQLPTIMNMLNNTEIRQALSNREVLNAVTQIQQGIQNLRQAVPDFNFGDLNIDQMPAYPPFAYRSNTNDSSSSQSDLTSPGATGEPSSKGDSSPCKSSPQEHPPIGVSSLSDKTTNVKGSDDNSNILESTSNKIKPSATESLAPLRSGALDCSTDNSTKSSNLSTTLRSESQSSAGMSMKPQSSIGSSEEMYSDELNLMDKMGYGSKESNLEALIECNGNIDDAIERVTAKSNANISKTH